MKTLFVFLIFITSVNVCRSQVGIGTTTPNPSAILELRDTKKGLLIPRMTKANRMAISTPAEGLLVYQTDSNTGYWYFNAGQWKPIGDAANQGQYTLVLTGDITDSEAS